MRTKRITLSEKRGWAAEWQRTPFSPVHSLGDTGQAFLGRQVEVTQAEGWTIVSLTGSPATARIGHSKIPNKSANNFSFNIKVLDYILSAPQFRTQ
jgi:hypothetical protein